MIQFKCSFVDKRKMIRGYLKWKIRYFGGTYYRLQIDQFMNNLIDNISMLYLISTDMFRR